MVKHAVAQQGRPVDVIGVHDWTLVGLAVASKRISGIDKANLDGHSDHSVWDAHGMRRLGVEAARHRLRSRSA